METLFPYAHPVLQIQVNPSWIRLAEEHAGIKQKKKGNLKVSMWDISQRVVDLALLAYLKKAELITNPIISLPGRWTQPTTLVSGHTIISHGAAADERYNIGAKAKLKIYKKSFAKADVHVLGIYDPPYVDFIGWTDNHRIQDTTETHKGRVEIPAEDLRPMSTLKQSLMEK